MCEVTGAHELHRLAAVTATARPAHRADARKVNAFICSYGTLGKTDAIDARALARWQPRDTGATSCSIWC